MATHDRWNKNKKTNSGLHDPIPSKSLHSKQSLIPFTQNTCFNCKNSADQ